LIAILKIRRGSAFNFTQQKVLFTYLFFMIDSWDYMSKVVS